MAVANKLNAKTTSYINRAHFLTDASTQSLPDNQQKMWIDWGVWYFNKFRTMKQFNPLTLRRNFSWTFIGNVVYAACQWGMLVVLAKLGSPEMVGQFTLGLAVTAPVIMFANLQLRAVQATDARHEYIFEDYLGLRLITTGLGILIILGITLTAGYPWETLLVILVVGLAKAIESISDVFYGLIQQHEQMDRISISMMIKGPLSLLFLGIGVYLTHSVLWGAAGLLVAWTIVLVSYDIPNGALMLNNSSGISQIKVFGISNLAVALRPRWHLDKLKKLIWLALPLGFVMMLISLNTNIPRYFIERYLGERELGFFAAISYLMVATGIVVGALGQSASPRLAKYYTARNSIAFRTLLLKMVGIGLLMGVAGILVVLVAGREILTVLYRPEYAEYTDIFVLVMVTTVISDVGSFLGYGMTSARYFRIQMPVSFIVAAISAIACFRLIPSMGLRGAVIALLIAGIVQVVILLAIILHALHSLEKQPQENKDD
jgi:O-antigen/teichoic acid export membrane protein